MLSGSLSPSFRNNSNSSASVASDSGRPHKILSRSSVVSKPSQASYPQDVNQQIAALKEKAHQSFMQVIQVQQLHEQEMEDMRRQFEQKQCHYLCQIAELRQRVEGLETEKCQMSQNMRHHVCQFSGMDFTLDAIEPIKCQDESQLDQSSINSFIELVAMQGSEEHLRTVRQQVLSQLNNITTDNQDKVTKVRNMIDKLFDYISHLKREFLSLQEVYGQLKGTLDRQKEGNANTKLSSENIQKENRFMSEQIKRLAGQKMRVQRKSIQQQKLVKKLEEQVRKLEDTNRKTFKSQDCPMKKQKEQNSDSMDLNDFIQHNMNNMNNMIRSQPIKQPKWVLSKAHH